MSPLASLIQRAFQTLKPPPALTLSQWVEEYAHLPKTSAKPGKLRVAYTEYMREILDAVSDPKVERVVWQASSQVGKSTVQLCALGFFASQDPGTILYVLPTVDLAKDFRRERINPFFQATPTLRTVMAPQRSRDSENTISHVEFNGGNLTLAGANAPGGLASRPKRVVICDEIDRFPLSAGTEGDPVNLAIKRTVTFFNRKIVLVSSPGLTGSSRVEAAYIEGDQRRYHVPCPDCGFEQPLSWPQVRWNKDAEGQHDASSAEYACIDCGALWGDPQRHAAVRKGRWIASQPFKGTASFHLNEIASPFVSLEKIVTDFLAAKDNAERFKTFTNTSLAETWQEKGEVPDFQRLLDRRSHDRFLNIVPPDVAILTAGCDVQKNRLEISVWGWGIGLQASLIDHSVFEGDTSLPEVWAQLSAYLRSQWTGSDGRKHTLARCGLDTGYATQEAYRFARSHPGIVIAMKGDGKYNASKPVSGPSRPDITINGKKVKNGVALFTVSGSVFKSELYGHLRQDKPADNTTFPPGYVHLPSDTDDEFIQQLVSEQLVAVKQRNGFTRYEWQKLRQRNESLDCYVYARAAASIFGIDRFSPKKWATLIGDEVDVENDDAMPQADIAPVSAPPPILATREVLETLPETKAKRRPRVRDTSSGWKSLR